MKISVLEFGLWFCSLQIQLLTPIIGHRAVLLASLQGLVSFRHPFCQCRFFSLSGSVDRQPVAFLGEYYNPHIIPKVNL